MPAPPLVLQHPLARLEDLDCAGERRRDPLGGRGVGGGFNVLTHSNMTWGLSGAYHMVQAKNDLGSDVNFFQVGVDVLWGSR